MCVYCLWFCVSFGLQFLCFGLQTVKGVDRLHEQLEKESIASVYIYGGKGNAGMGVERREQVMQVRQIYLKKNNNKNRGKSIICFGELFC